MFLREVCFVSLLFVSAVRSRPQQEPGNSIPPDGPRVAIVDRNRFVIEKKIDYNLLGQPKLCGFSTKNISSIARTGGGMARFRDWPWMTVFFDKNYGIQFCGGALITPRHVLTAAHCFTYKEVKDIFVRVGEYDLATANETLTNDVEVQEIRSHEDYDPSTYEHDIAILKLAEPVKYSIYTQPICLPLPSQDFTNTIAIVSGWGSVSFGGPMSDVLLEVPVPIWEQAECVDHFEQTIFDTVQCAAAPEGGKDACQGDSGGPLMSQREDGRWVTIGIVSWGIRCGEKGKPGIYTRVNKYLDWIAENTQDVK